jgi:hypothetical protein
MKDAIKEDKLSPIVIDLTRKNSIDESWLRMFGGAIKGILGAMFGGTTVPVEIKGTRSDVNSFVAALGGEKSYIETLKKYGLYNPRTARSKASLDSSVAKFERGTGIKWPFK